LSGCPEEHRMFFLDMCPGQEARVGPRTLRVLAVLPAVVVLALLDPGRDGASCGRRPAARRRCPVCQAEALLCADCVPSRPCPRCASPWRAG
jgi:hypothetical protein